MEEVDNWLYIPRILVCRGLSMACNAIDRYQRYYNVVIGNVTLEWFLG